MHNDEHRIQKTLNDLTRIAQDGHDGYQAAGQNLPDADLDLKKVFGRHALERKRFVEELQQEVVRLGGMPQRHGSVKGAAHRGWIEAKTSIGDHTARKILEEVVRGETAAVDAYEEALDSDLPSEPRGIVTRQLERIQETRDEMRARRDGLAK